MKKLYILLSICLWAILQVQAQSAKKTLDENAYFEWKSIEEPRLSHLGNWVCYQIKPGHGDPTLAVYNAVENRTDFFNRGTEASFAYQAPYLIFRLTPPKSHLDSLRRKKVKKEDFPADTLAILALHTGGITKIPNIDRFTVPKKWSGCVLYELNIEADSSWNKHLPRELRKDEKVLISQSLSNGKQDTFTFVQSYEVAEEGPTLLVHANAPDTSNKVYLTHFNLHSGTNQEITSTRGKIDVISLDKTGAQGCFVANNDTLGNEKNRSLHYFNVDPVSKLSIVKEGHEFLDDSHIVSLGKKPFFSESGDKIFFGISSMTKKKDTTLLEDETAVVEVWNYLDGRLYTQQEVRVDEEKKRHTLCVYHIESQKMATLGPDYLSNSKLADDGNGSFAIASDNRQYLPLISWEGKNYHDLFHIDLFTGELELVQSKVSGNVEISPDGQFLFWFESIDTTWYTFELATKKLTSLTNGRIGIFHDELNDQPNHPRQYGVAGWLAGDKSILIYDRYDIWEFDPRGIKQARNITEGRKNHLVSRYIKLEPDAKIIPQDSMYVHIFDEETKFEGYECWNLENGTKRRLFYRNNRLQRRPSKAAGSDKVVFTIESFEQFPNLYLSDLAFNEPKQISNVNKQQSEYRWGTIEDVNWTDHDGILRKGLLVKPDDFDPTKKYPMIVNFYERSSHTLHRHRPPVPGRSTIGYAFYASNGYLIFNPDVHYKIGAPGQSAFDAVVSGTEAMIEKGFVDPERIGLQGHSWGGYQIADILTKTDMFKCAESGAPVVNMISAYGGIRWGSGMSRMFQYEHTQSRLGATLWERPDLYLKNSPILNLDKITTPVLILHNDEDTAVPWYQGIEFFVGMRRLNKPAWLLNYNGEPHWPLKWPNRLDFNKRMLQFFNHYLQDQPMPRWMSKGIPAVDKGIEFGFELDGN